MRSTRPPDCSGLEATYDGVRLRCPPHLAVPAKNRLWLGEGFNPDSPPGFWLIEMSGIPFGLSSDLLEKPNPWRGMLFGMTNRALYSRPLPTPIWKLWDTFGIEDAAMIGWWNKNVPVKTVRSDVLATVYRKPGKAMIAIANWAGRTVSIQLAVDWQALGLEKQGAKLSAPEMGYFQSARDFSVDQSISIPAGKGCLLILEQDSAGNHQ